MIDSEKAAPYATGVLRKGLPIFDRNLKELLKEIQNKAKIACKEAKGSDTEEIARAVNQEVHNCVIGSQEEMTQMIESLIEVFRLKMSYLPNYEYLFREIEGIKDEKDLAKQYKIFSKIIEKIPIFTIMPNYVIQYIKEIKQKADVIDEKLDILYDKTVSIETKLDLIQKTLDKGFEKLDILSSEIGGKEGELIKNFSKKVHELIEKKDKETLENFLEEIHKKENILTEEIEKSSAPLEEKEESKRSILNVRSVLDKVKHPIKSFGKDVTNEIIVSYTAKETVKLVFQLVSMAVLGFPIPTPILNLLSSMVEDL